MDNWIETLADIIHSNKVDLVIPVSTINEILALCLARDLLSPIMLHVKWIWPGLHNAIRLDERESFAKLCRLFKVSTTDSCMLITGS